MGNSKHSTVRSTTTGPQDPSNKSHFSYSNLKTYNGTNTNQTNQRSNTTPATTTNSESQGYYQNGGINRRQKQPASYHGKRSSQDYADLQLGRLRSVDFRLGKVFLQSGNNTMMDGMLLENLYSPSTFLFSRTCSKGHNGFGFSCGISFKPDGKQDGQIVVNQMPKPRKGYKDLENSPLDVFDITSEYQRQVLGIVFKKDEPQLDISAIEIYTIQGVIGSISVKGDWTNAYEIKNPEGEASFTAKRFNRISGGLEFQIYSMSQTELAVCIATFVRLEESKFILKLYAPTPPIIKSMLISFSIFLIYLLSK